MYNLSAVSISAVGVVPSGKDADALTAAGRVIGAALGHYLVWLGRAAAREGAQRLHFLSREGAWLAIHYARLRQLHPNGDAWPRPVTLAVSRRSTFLPSLADVSQASLAPLLVQYKQVSAATVLFSLGLNMSRSATVPVSITSLPLDRPWAEAGVAQTILGDPWIAQTLEQRRIAQRDALLSYLSQKEVMNCAPLTVADIGWSGTIQDNLARLMPDRRLIGHYFALRPQRLRLPNNEKFGFILGEQDQYRIGRRLRFVAPLEFIATDATTSALEYVIEDGQSRPVMDELVVAPVSLPAFSILQKGVEVGIVDAAFLTLPSASLARSKVLKFLEAPPLALVNVFFEAWRDDRFGGGVLRRGAPPLCPKRLLLALVKKAERRALGIELAESGWPWGLLVRDMPFVAPLLRRLVLGFDARL